MKPLNQGSAGMRQKPLSAATDSVRVQGGNTELVGVSVHNLPSDPAKDASLQAIKARIDLLASDATAQEIRNAVLDQVAARLVDILQELQNVKAQQTSGTQNTEVTNFPLVQPISSATLDAILAVLGSPTDSVYAGGVAGTLAEVLKGIFSTLTGTVRTEAASLPLPVGAATEVTLQALTKAMQNAASSVWTDDSGAFYMQRQDVDSATGTVTITYTDAQGTVVTPGVGLRPFVAGGETSGGGTSVSFESYWTAVATAAEYVASQTLAQFSVFDTATTPPTKVMSAWVNVSTGFTLTAPPAEADIVPQANTVSVSNVVEVITQALPLPAGAATETGLASILSKVASLGALGDVAWTGTGNGSVISIAKASHDQSKAAALALGTPADTEWTGIGVGTLTSIAKRIVALLKGSAITGVAMPVGGDGNQGWLSAIYKQLSTGVSSVAMPVKSLKVFGYTIATDGSTLSWSNSIKSVSFKNAGLANAVIYDISDSGTKTNGITLEPGDVISFQAGPGETYGGFALDAQGTTVKAIVERVF